MTKANKTMVKFTFDTYDSLRKQVHDRIIDYINTGKADDIDLNDPLRFFELWRIILESDRKLYIDSVSYVKMESVLGDTFGFRYLFSSVDGKLDAIINAWRFIFLSVFIEHYHEFKEIWERRKSSSNIESV